MNPPRSFSSSEADREPPLFEQIEEAVKYEGHVISVVEAKFRSPNGEQVTREIARHPGAVCVVPIVSEEIIMVRQFRASTNQNLLEIPAGKRDVAHEPPEVTAERELQEEVGLKTEKMILLAEFFNTHGFCDEYSYCYLALDCQLVQDNRQGLEEELMTIERVPLEQARALIARGDLIDAKSMLGILLALQYLDG